MQRKRSIALLGAAALVVTIGYIRSGSFLPKMFYAEPRATSSRVMSINPVIMETASTSKGGPKQTLRQSSPSQPEQATAVSSTTTTRAAATDATRPLYFQDEVRQWGCKRRHDAPLIFVHIGKSGGGSVRARLAASALHYNRKNWYESRKDKTYYYPIQTETESTTSNTTDTAMSATTGRKLGAVHTVKLHKGVLINSLFNNFRPMYPPLEERDSFTEEQQDKAEKTWKTYERTMPCAARTPLGQAIACPFVRLSPVAAKACHGKRCDVVYTGHNLLGSELHWLPRKYLYKWWKRTPWSRGLNGTKDEDAISVHLRSKALWQNKNSTCACKGKHPTMCYKSNYFDCVAPLERIADRDALDVFGESPSSRDDDVLTDWSPIYASLPVLRVTMLREPFSWLVSKYFWHYGMAKRLIGRRGNELNVTTCDNDLEGLADWAGSHALKFIHHLCGEDCVVRTKREPMMTLEQVELQAKHNLQHSFAVVGLLNETQTFYDMVTARAGFMNTTLNPEVKGSSHSTKMHDDKKRCDKVFQTEEFQKKFLELCPEMAALNRLFQVGLQVNRAQLQEMQTCGTI